MKWLRPKHPILRAILATLSAVWYLRQWRRGKKRPPGKVVDATAKVIEEKNNH